MAKDRVLQKFDHSIECAIKNFEKYVLQGIGVETGYDFKSGCISGMIGDEEFIEETLTNCLAKQQREVTLSDLIEKVCEINNLSQEQLCMPGKVAKYSQVRALLAFLVREIDSISLMELARTLGRDISSLAKLASRFEVKIASDPLALQKVRVIREWLTELPA